MEQIPLLNTQTHHGENDYPWEKLA